jgi:predicted DNA-binding WGR domain protein
MAFDRTGGQHGAMQTTHQLEAAELVKIVPAKKQARFYRLAIWPDLFGGFSLAREYGGRLCLTPFPEPESARQAFARIVRRKQRRGYVRAPADSRINRKKRCGLTVRRSYGGSTSRISS